MKRLIGILVSCGIASAWSILTAWATDPLPPGVFPHQDGGGLLYHASLDNLADADRNRWPDGWARQTGTVQNMTFPSHVEVGIRDNPNPYGLQSLNVAVAGGGVALFTPRIPIRPGMTYEPRIGVDASGLVHNTIRMNLAFYGKGSTKPLKTLVSETLGNTNGWQTLRIAPVSTENVEADYLIVGLLILPGHRQDLSGSVDFADMRIYETPTVTLSTNNANHLFVSPLGIDVRCRITGAPSTLRNIDFILEDTYGRELARQTAELRSQPTVAPTETDVSLATSIDTAESPSANRPSSRFAEITATASPEAKSQSLGPASHALWRDLPIYDPGFYRVRVVSHPGFPSDGSKQFSRYAPTTPGIPYSFQGVPATRLRLPDTSPARDTVQEGEQALGQGVGQNVGTTTVERPRPAPTVREGEVQDKDFDPLANTPPLTLAYLETQPAPVGGEFGWSLHGLTPAMLEQVRPLLGQAGLSRVKLPTWLPSDASREDWERLHNVAFELSMRRIVPTGLLVPPPEIAGAVVSGPADAASVFSRPETLWWPSIEKMLFEMSMLVKQWQLSTDEDTSALQIPGMRSHLSEIRKKFNTLDYDVALGFAWDWTMPIPPSFRDDLPAAQQAQADAPVAPPPVDSLALPPLEQIPARPSALLDSREFVAVGTGIPLTAEELAYQLRSSEGTNVRRYVNLSPLPKNAYSTQDRVLDLVRRMLVAKINRADAVFIPHPFHDETGLMNADGTPAELFLPWRTTSLLLCGRRYAGSFRMPGGSRNVLFEDGTGQGLLVLWNEGATLEEPVEEVLYLGRDCGLVTLDGHRERVPRIGREQVVPSGPVPIFVTGIDMGVARWRQGFELEYRNIPSYPHAPFDNRWTFRNPSTESVAAELTLLPPQPEGWIFTPDAKSFILGPRGTESNAFTVTLTPEATSGPHPMRIRVKTDNEDFFIYEELNVGADDIAMEFMTRLNRNGELEVHQRFLNDSDRIINYHCSIYVAESKVALQTCHIENLAFGQHLHMYRYPNGKALLGKTLLVEALPIGPVGQPLRYQFTATAGSIAP